MVLALLFWAANLSPRLGVFQAPTYEEPPKPPVKRAWTVQVTDPIADSVTVGNVVYLCAGSSCYAFDPVHRHFLWRKTLPHGFSGYKVAGDGQTLCVFATAAGKDYEPVGRVFSLDERNGAIRFSKSCLATSIGGVFSNGVILTWLSHNELSAVDGVTGKVRWTAKEVGDLGISPLATDGNVAFATGDSGNPPRSMTAIDIKTGKRLWSVNPTSQRIDCVLDGVVLLGDFGIVGRDASTGKVKWKLDYDTDLLQAWSFGNKFLLNTRQSILALDPATGKTLWSYRLPLQGGSAMSADQVCGHFVFKQYWATTVVLSSGGGAVSYDLDSPATTENGGISFGEEQYRTVWFDHRTLVATEFNRILGFEPGRMSPLPKSSAERKRLAEHLCANFESLDYEERHEIVELGHISFEPLMEKLGTTVGQEGRWMHDSGYILELIEKVARPEDAARMIELERSLKKDDPVKEGLVGVIARTGAEDIKVPYLIAKFRHTPPDQWYPGDEFMALCRSPDPRAIRFTTEAMHNSRYDEVVRTLALGSLSASAEGRKVVAAELSHPPKFDKDWFRKDPSLKQYLAGPKDKRGMPLKLKSALGLDPSKLDNDGDGIPDRDDAWPNVPERPLKDEAENVFAAAFEVAYHFSKTGALYFVRPDKLSDCPLSDRIASTIAFSFDENPKPIGNLGYIRCSDVEFDGPDHASISVGDGPWDFFHSGYNMDLQRFDGK